MYGTIPEVSPGAAQVNEAIRQHRAQIRATIIGRPQRLTLSVRLAQIAAADRDRQAAS